MKRWAQLTALLFLLTACGRQASVDLTGTWSGTTTTAIYGAEQTNFTLSQSGNQVSGTVSLTSAETLEAPVTGSVTGDVAAVSATFALTEGGTVTYQYAGTVTNAAFGGTVTLTFSTGEQQTGQFSVTR